jgi:hypothetical protein
MMVRMIFSKELVSHNCTIFSKEAAPPIGEDDFMGENLGSYFRG